MKKNLLAVSLQAAGTIAISAGIFLVFMPAGIVIGGVFLTLFGLALERRNAQ
jgi:hypothetical protein